MSDIQLHGWMRDPRYVGWHPSDGNYAAEQGSQEANAYSDKVVRDFQQHSLVEALESCTVAMLDVEVMAKPWVSSEYFVGMAMWLFYRIHPEYLPAVEEPRHPLDYFLDIFLGLSEAELSECNRLVHGVLSSQWAQTIGFGGSYRFDDPLNVEKNEKCSLLARRLVHQRELHADPQNVDSLNLFTLIAAQEPDTRLAEKKTFYERAFDLSLKQNGKLNRKTAEIAQSLGLVYIKLEQSTIADILLQWLYKEQQLARGKDHAETKRAGLALAYCLWNMGSESKSRGLLWSMFKDESSELHRQLFPTQPPYHAEHYDNDLRVLIRYMKEHNMHRCFQWSSLEICLFPFDTIRFKTIYPSDEEKQLGWIPAMGAEFETQEMSKARQPYSSKIPLEGDAASTTLEVPFLTYRHYLSSTAYRIGRPYQEYRSASLESPLIKKNAQFNDRAGAVGWGENTAFLDRRWSGKDKFDVNESNRVLPKYDVKAYQKTCTEKEKVVCPPSCCLKMLCYRGSLDYSYKRFSRTLLSTMPTAYEASSTRSQQIRRQ